MKLEFQFYYVGSMCSSDSERGDSVSDSGRHLLSRGLCISKMLTAILKCVGMGISLLIGGTNEDQSVLVMSR